MRKLLAVLLVVIVGSAGCGGSGSDSAGPDDAPTSSTTAEVARTTATTTTKTAPTTTMPAQQAMQEMTDEVTRACEEAAQAAADPQVRYDPAWSPYFSEPELMERAKGCVDAKYAALEETQRREEEARTHPQPDGAGVYRFEWTSRFDGWKYEIGIQILGTTPNGMDCLGTAPPGQTYVKFKLTVTNRITDRPAPADPSIWLGSNVSRSAGQPEQGKFDADTVNLTPHGYLSSAVDEAMGGDGDVDECALRSTPGGSDIGPGSTATFQGIVGPVAQPVPEGILLIASNSASGADDVGVGDLRNLFIPVPAGGT